MLKDVPLGIFMYFMTHLILCQPVKTMQAAMTMAKNPQTNLTRTEEALLSPEEQVIASRT